jgi:selenocysteine-specific elongation factor
MVKNVIVGTAGHIDHGKSSLVEALTGVHPDRLKEEKDRGITIDLGFAHLLLDERVQIGFVDVPGHERFIKNMLAGVGGIDAVLLVVAADESIMPQTREHFDICKLLRIPRGMVAITKVDLVETELLELVKLEVREFLKGSFLENAPIVPVSTKPALGLVSLKECLLQVCDSVPARSADAVLRLPIDRCFTLHGFGTVITGTLLSGSIRKEDEVEIYPAKIKARVRGLQVHSKPVSNAYAGQRTAVNLSNVEVGDIHRGMEISVPGRFDPVSRCDARVELLTSSPIQLSRKTEVRFHVGTSEQVAAIKPLAGQEIKPGQSGLVRIQFEQPILLIPGDRFIFRRLSPMMTLGGGTVLDIEPGKIRNGRRVTEFLNSIESLGLETLVAQHAERRGPRCLSEIEMLSQTVLKPEAVRAAVGSLVNQDRLRLISDEPWQVISHHTFAQLMKEIVLKLQSFHRENPLLTGIQREQIYSSAFKSYEPLAFKAALNQLVAGRQAVVENELVRLPGKAAVLGEAESAAKHQIEQAFLRAGLTVPLLDEVLSVVPVSKDPARKIVSLLAKEGRLIKVSENLIFHVESIQKLKQLLAGYKANNDRIDVGKFKDLTGISRKYAIPLLEFLDRERVTRRVGDFRVIL